MQLLVLLLAKLGPLASSIGLLIDSWPDGH
jgi:hypothetical protein